MRGARWLGCYAPYLVGDPPKISNWKWKGISIYCNPDFAFLANIFSILNRQTCDSCDQVRVTAKVSSCLERSSTLTVHENLKKPATVNQESLLKILKPTALNRVQARYRGQAQRSSGEECARGECKCGELTDATCSAVWKSINRACAANFENINTLLRFVLSYFPKIRKLSFCFVTKSKPLVVLYFYASCFPITVLHAVSDECEDQDSNCAAIASFCANRAFAATMLVRCKKTCGFCKGESLNKVFYSGVFFQENFSICWSQ